MLFNSAQFLIFFPVVSILYFILPHRFRWFLLLVAGAVFYMAFIPAYILILLATIAVDYIAGIYIEKSQGRKRKLYLLMSIVANVGFLAFFKYYNFGAANLMALAQFLHWNYSLPLLSVILPIGLSFHTFQAMSYTIEVYRGNQAAERHFGIYALYVLFYPQLVAGPIERPQNLIHQFKEEHRFDYQRVTDGLKLMLWGMFKKVVIADRVASFVDVVYNDPAQFQGVSFIVATVLFAFQIYCDFSGYSDIAIGAAQVMGFRLMRNFDRPYFSRSIGEFWRRWHISLSTWFRDYVYIPLGGNRVSLVNQSFNVLLIFLLSGLWHGAGWTFIIWGGLHGLYLIFSLWTRSFRQRIVAFLRLDAVPGFRAVGQTVVTFILVCFSWFFFRARSLSDAFYIVRNLFSGFGNLFTDMYSQVFIEQSVFLGQGASRVWITASSIALLLLVDYLSKRPALASSIFWFRPVRWTAYVALFWFLVFFGKFGERQFIYFVF